MMILVTGANGFVGRSAVKALAAAGHVVSALDLRDEGHFKGIKLSAFFSQNIADPVTLPERFDCLIHLAAYNITHVGDADAGLYESVNVRGTQNILKGVQADHVVFLSTVKVYGRAVGSIDEAFPVAPVHAYEQSKWQAEELCRRMVPADRLTILRSVNIIGPGQAEKAVIPVFLRQALKNEPINVFAPRRLAMQLIDIEDIAVLFTLLVQVKPAGVFNVAPGDMIRLEDIAERIKNVSHSSSEIQYMNHNEVPDVRISGARLEAVLNWHPSVAVDESLRRCYARYAQ